MRDWASSGGIKIKRAKKHIRDFEWVTGGFFRAHPYRVLAEHNVETRMFSFYAEESFPVPLLEWSPIAADAIHNLRSSLDHLWLHVMYPNAPVGTRKGQFFPIYDSREKYEADRGRVIQGRRKTAMDILHEIKPYKGGNDLLWSLHRLDISDKHEMLTLVVGAFKEWTLIIPTGTPGQAYEAGMHVDDFILLKGRTKLPSGFGGEFTDGPIMNVHGKLTPHIAFGEGEILERQAVVSTLDQCADLVEGIARAYLAAGLLT